MECQGNWLEVDKEERGIKEDVLVFIAKASFNHWRLKEHPNM
jgi:hypothetical protein